MREWVPQGLGEWIAGAGLGLDDVSRNYMPYLVALLIALGLIAAFPYLTLVLPRLFLGYRG